MWKSKFCNDVTHVRDDEHKIEAHKEMVNFQDHSNGEIRTMAHKYKANSQDNTGIINGDDVTHVGDDDHRIQAHKDMVNDHDNTNKEIRTMANNQDKIKIMNGGKFFV